MSVITTKQSNGAVVDYKRVIRIVVLVSEPEKRKFQKMAKDRHTDLSELVRQLLHKESEGQAA